MFSDRLTLSYRAESKLFHAVRLHDAKLCWLINVCSLGWWIHPVDADQIQGRPPIFFIGMYRVPADRQERHHGLDTFPYISAQVLRSQKQTSAVMEASGGCKGLEWCGPGIVLVTINEPWYSVWIAAVILGCQPVLSAEYCGSPADNEWKLAILAIMTSTTSMWTCGTLSKEHASGSLNSSSDGKKSYNISENDNVISWTQQKIDAVKESSTLRCAPDCRQAAMMQARHAIADRPRHELQ